MGSYYHTNFGTFCKLSPLLLVIGVMIGILLQLQGHPENPVGYLGLSLMLLGLIGLLLRPHYGSKLS